MSIREVHDSNYREAIPAEGLALLDFGAAWCPPCRALLPILEEIDRELGDKVAILKIDTDDAPEAASAYGVLSLPTVVVFRDGQPVDKFVGLRSKAAYLASLAR
ncbi:thioredoxin family protein [Gorillibacterium sp. sgz5001074]|uniref:thioredoxin family protein n=1 Tax=Gorillibacterium sp. sgz5001074 TaxID=3446695 RepID=UPI003F680598